MALVIAEVSMVALAVLAVKTFLEYKDERKKLLRPLYISADITGGLCLLYALFDGSVMRFTSCPEIRDIKLVFIIFYLFFYDCTYFFRS